jgi:adenylate cyclase class 2
MEEIEVKFLNINAEEIQKKLQSIGAKRAGEYFQRWKTFDYPDWRLDKEGAWIRLRDEGDEKTTLTFKKRLGMQSREGAVNDAGMEEVEVYVSDFDTTALLFEKFGFVEKHYAEKKRIRWEKDGVEFDIDTYPGLEPYIEIEATSWEEIDTAIKLLELNNADKKIFSANQVYALQGIDVKKLIKVTFAEGLIERDK